MAKPGYSYIAIKSPTYKAFRINATTKDMTYDQYLNYLMENT